MGQGLLHRVTGAELFGLFVPGDVGIGKRGADLFAAVTVDHVDAVGAERAGSDAPTGPPESVPSAARRMNTSSPEAGK